MKHYVKNTENNTKAFCPLCDRIITENVPKSIHHLIPKSKGGKGGEIVLAGFYPGSLKFQFSTAFMKEAKINNAKISLGFSIMFF